MGKTRETNKKRPAKSESGDEPIAKRLRHSTRISFGTMLESLTKNPGLQHIAEEIFQNLDKHSLLKLRLVNSSWKGILDRPMFWYRKLKRDGIFLSETILSGMRVKLTYSFLVPTKQNLDPNDYEEQKKFALKMIKMSILEIRRREKCEDVIKILAKPKPHALKKKQTAIKNEIFANKQIMRFISAYFNCCV